MKLKWRGTEYQLKFVELNTSDIEAKARCLCSESQKASKHDAESLRVLVMG